jgi:hypothetical protein
MKGNPSFRLGDNEQFEQSYIYTVNNSLISLRTVGKNNNNNGCRRGKNITVHISFCLRHNFFGSEHFHNFYKTTKCIKKNCTDFQVKNGLGSQNVSYQKHSIFNYIIQLANQIRTG